MSIILVSRGSGIDKPFREIHTSDLARLHSIGPDFSRTDPEKINWAKFSAMGKIIGELVRFQGRCRRHMKGESAKYNFPERKDIRYLIVKTEIMDDEVSYAYSLKACLGVTLP